MPTKILAKTAAVCGLVSRAGCQVVSAHANGPRGCVIVDRPPRLDSRIDWWIDPPPETAALIDSVVIRWRPSR